MFSVGLMANTGADFFSLFSPEGKKVKDKISLDDVTSRWEPIDHNDDGVITKQEAAAYIASAKETNPLNWVMHKVASHFDIEEDFSMLIFILVASLFLKPPPFFSPAI